MGDGKAKSVLQYLDNLVDKGRASAGAIGPLKIAFTKVLQTIDGDTWTQTDVRTINIEDYMARFANLTMGKYSSDSLAAYRTRANKALIWYITSLDTPGWMPDVQRRKPPARLAGTQDTQAEFAYSGHRTQNLTPIQLMTNTQPTDAMIDPADATVQPTAPGRIVYPYPLSNGELVYISLPLKLSKQDAKRIGSFVDSIAVDE